MKRIRFGVLLLALVYCASGATPVVAANPSLAEQFQTLKDTIRSLELPSEVESNLLDLTNIAEVHATDGITDFTATEGFLDSLLSQIVALMLKSQSSAGAVVAQDDGEEPIDIFVNTVNSITATLFFAAPPLVIHAPPMETVPEGECSVRLLARIIGPSLYDPGGLLSSRFGDMVELEAQTQPAGGSYTWSLEPEGDTPFQSESNRLTFRGVDPWTFRVTVKYSGPDGEECEDVLLVRVQGDTPPT